MDGRPEMWPWILKYVRYEYDVWLGHHLNDQVLAAGVRDGGYTLLYTAWLAKVHPDPAVRAELLAKARAGAKDYYPRLQYPDGSWRWADPPPGIPGMFEQPFMVGLLLEGLVATHQLTGDPETLNAIAKSAEHLYRDAYRKDEPVAAVPTMRWRGMWYFLFGDQCNLPVNTSPTTVCGQVTLVDLNSIREARQLNPHVLHAFGYVYSQTHDARFRTWGDDIFAATFGNGQGPGSDASYSLADYRAKEYDQNYRSSGRYLAWRLGN